MSEAKEGIWIKGIRGNFGLEIYLPSRPELVAEFETICRQIFLHTDLGDQLGAFFQGGHNLKEWKYFEFWKSTTPDKQDILLDIAIAIADRLDLELEIDLN